MKKLGKLYSWSPTLYLSFLAGMNPRYCCSMCLFFLFYQSPSIVISWFPINFFWTRVYWVPLPVSPGHPLFAIDLFFHVCLPALVPDYFMLSLLFLIFALRIFLCPLSFQVPPLTHLYSSFLASFLEGKWEAINHDIMPFEDNHDLLSRLLGWNGHSKHNDERIKFLYYQFS